MFRLNPDATAQALKYFGLFQSYVPPEKEYKKPYDALEAGNSEFKNLLGQAARE